MEKQRMYVSIADRTILSSTDQAAALEVIVNEEELAELHYILGQLADADSDALIDEFTLISFKPIEEINARYQSQLDSLYRAIYRSGTPKTRHAIAVANESIGMEGAT